MKKESDVRVCETRSEGTPLAIGGTGRCRNKHAQTAKMF